MIRDTLTQHTGFFKQVASSVASNGAGILLGFVVSIILARELGPDGRGMVSWLISLHIIATAFTQFGTTNLNRRYAAEKPYAANHYRLLTLLAVGGSSLLVLPLFYGFAHTNPIAETMPLALFIALLGVPLLAAADALAALLVGLHHARGYNIVILSQKLCNLLLIGGLFLIGGLTPFTAVLALMLAVVVKFAIAFYFLRHRNKGTLKGAIAQAKRHKTYMLINHISNLAQLLASHAVVLIMGVETTAEQVGYFAVAYAFIEAMATLSRMFSMYAVPNLVRLKTPQERRQFKAIATIMLCTLLLGAAGVFYLIAPWLVTLVFGEAFTPSISVFRTLLIGLVFFGSFQLFHSMITAMYQGWVILLPPVISAVTLIVTSLVLVPNQGAEGAAQAWLIANIAAMFGAAMIIFNEKRETIHEPQR